MELKLLLYSLVLLSSSFIICGICEDQNQGKNILISFKKLYFEKHEFKTIKRHFLVVLLSNSTTTLQKGSFLLTYKV